MLKEENIAVSPSGDYTRRRTLFTNVLLAPGAGLAASLLTVVVMGLLFFGAGIPTPVDLFGDHLLKNIDVHTFIILLNTFAPHSKTAPLGLALLGMIAIGTALSWLYALLARVKLPVSDYRPGKREWLVALAFTAAMTLIGVVLFWGELRKNLLALPIGWAMLATALALLIDFSVYGVALCLLYRAILPKSPRQGTPVVAQKRRQLLVNTGVAALTVGAGLGAFGEVQGYLGKYAAYDGARSPSPDNVTPPITPNDVHYVVTQNTVDPAPDIAFWRLEVTGLVSKPGSYTYESLQKLPSVSRGVTLECISNGLGDHLMGTAIWQGVTLQTLLKQHGTVQPAAKFIAFHSVDGYTISLALDEVLAVDPILAWRMNGAELPVRHGYPLRALIPGRYGEENPKWLTRIELTDHFVQGLYSSQGWYNGPLRTTSRIDHPRGTITRGQAVEIGGVAFAGDRGIQKVEVSVDAGVNWKEAALAPPISADSWVFWKLSWLPETAGSYRMQVRATDGRGQLQTDHRQGVVPNGGSGYHEVTVIVQ